MATESDIPIGGNHPDVEPHPEERAAKRIKIDDAAPAQEESGQNASDAKQNGNHVEASDNSQSQLTSEAPKRSEENGEPDNRIKGLAPIKKE
jgi:tRNA-dihydrouridine synthase 3